MVEYDRGYYLTVETLIQGHTPNYGEPIKKTIDLDAYEKSHLYKFSKQFREQFARVIQHVNVTGAEFRYCGLCSLTGLISGFPGKWHGNQHSSSASAVEYAWPYILALSQECDSCHVLKDFVRSCLKDLGNHDFAARMETAKIGSQVQTFAMGHVAATNQKERIVAVEITIKAFPHMRRHGFMASKTHQRVPVLSSALLCTERHIDSSRMRQWLSKCDQHHACRVYVEDKPLAIEPIRAIDIQNMRLVETSNLQHCAVLSYTWGPIQLMPVKLLRNNLSNMKLEGAFLKLWSDLPQTIRDAINVSRSLGMKYLWCDVLCIIQDDESDMQFQMSRMYTIYKYCYVTLVAAAGQDAQAGLPGSLDHPREHLQWRWCRGPEVCVVEIPGTMKVVHESPWNSRGWTLQEAYLSHRMLIFTPDQVIFQCQTTVWYEVAALEEIFEHSVEYGYGHFGILRGKDGAGYMPGGSHAPVLSSTISRLKVPDGSKTLAWERYLILIYHYSSRRLSKPTDVLNAVSGVLTQLEQTYGWEFHFGLPLSMFPVALCFKSSIRKKTASRIFPSWSWCDALNAGPSYVYSPEGNPFDYRSTAMWFRANPGDSDKLQPIVDIIEPLDPTSKVTEDRYSSIHSSMNQVKTDLSVEEAASLVATVTDCVPVGPPESTAAQEAAIYNSFHDPTNTNYTFAYYHVISKREAEGIYTLLVGTDSRGISQRISLIRWKAQEWQLMLPQPRLLLLV